ncbi:MAG: MFS transporter [Thermoguttaceae bacterium]|nr:MFS transporter [Thermoguttaceae bacterium]
MTRIKLPLAYLALWMAWRAWTCAIVDCRGLGDNFVALGLSWFIVGACLAPLVGAIVDRWVDPRKALAFLSACGAGAILAFKAAIGGGSAMNETLALGAVALGGVAILTSIVPLNVILFKSLRNKNDAPFILLFGTLGQLCVDSPSQGPIIHYIGAGASLFLAVWAAFALETPPASEASSQKRIFRGAKRYFICLFFAVIFGLLFWNKLFYMTVRLTRPQPDPAGGWTFLLRYASFEVAFMAALAFIARIVNLKNILLIGMAAWATRYILLASTGPTTLVAEPAHGFCYVFLYVASYMYVDRIAPEEKKATLQGWDAAIIHGFSNLAATLVFTAMHYAMRSTFPDWEFSSILKGISAVAGVAFLATAFIFWTFGRRAPEFRAQRRPRPESEKIDQEATVR